MGRSKGSKSKPPKPSKSNKTTPSGSSFDLDIIRKARKAYHLAASKHQIAQKQIRDLCVEHSNIGLLFRTQAEILEKCYDEATATDKKERIMENAIQCARKAISLSPNSMDFSSFLGHLFYRSSVEANGYKKAIEQFNTALNIPRPSDPAKETLLTDEEIQSRFPTYKARIEDARKRIFKHIGNCVVMLKDLQTSRSVINEYLQIVEVNNDEEKLYVAWHSLSVYEKHRLFQVSVVDLKSRLVSLKNHYEVLSLALAYFEYHQKWQFWMCCTCTHKFPTSVFYLNHLVRTHLKDLLAEFKNAFSLRIIDWIAFIENIKWKALDTPAVITTLEKKRQSKSSTPESSSGKREGQFLPEKIPHEEYMKKRSLFEQESLLSSDSERETLLSKIQKKLQGLVSSDWFMAFHLDMMIQRAMKKLTGLLGDCLKELNMEHYCLCLLDASQLEEIIRFLDEMSNFTRKIRKKKGINEDILSSRIRPTEIEGGISLNKDSLYLILDEHSLRKESTSGSSSKKDNSKHQQPIVDDWISWICSGPSSDEHMEEWINLEDQKTSQAKEQLAKFEKVLSGSSKNRHEIQEKLAADVVPTNGSGPEVGKETGTSLQKPEKDTPVQAMIHEEEEDNDSVLSESDRQILDVSVDIQQLELILSCIAVYNYQPIVLSIVKSYIREHLEGIVGNIAIKKYDAAAGNVDALIGKDLGTEEVRHALEMEEPIVDDQESDLGQTSATTESFQIIFGSFKPDEFEQTRRQNLVNQQVGLGGTEGLRNTEGLDPAEIEEAMRLSFAELNVEDGGTDNPEDDNRNMIDILDKHGITIEVQSVDDVEEADKRMRTSLPLRPELEAIKAVEVPSEIIANRDQLLEVIYKKKRPQDIPEEQFKLLKKKQKNFLLYLIDQEKRKASELFGLEKIHALMEDPGSSSSSDTGSDVEDVKQGHFAVIAMDAGKPKRYEISMDYINHPDIRRLVDQAENQCGFEHKGALTLPCSAAELDTILSKEWEP